MASVGADFLSEKAANTSFSVRADFLPEKEANDFFSSQFEEAIKCSTCEEKRMLKAPFSFNEFNCP